MTIVDAGVAQAARPAHRGAGRVDDRAGGGAAGDPPSATRSSRCAGGESTRGSIWPAIYPELLRARARAHLDDRVRQQPPLGRARRAAPERAGRRGAERGEVAARSPAPPRLARARGAHEGRGAAEGRASCPASSPPARWSSASTWARSTSSCRSSRPSRSRAACSASAAPATASARSAAGGSSPSSAATCSSARSSPGACTKALIEPTVVPRNALDVLAQQIVAIAVAAEPAAAGGQRGRRRGGAAPRRASRSTSCTRSSRAPTPTPSSRASCSRTCSTCSTGATPRKEFGELRARIVWDRVAGTIRARKGVAPARDRQRRHDPRPRAVRGHAARRAARGRARRGDGLRGAARPGVPARRLHLADRGDRPRPRDRHARARRARARCRSGRATRSGRPKELGRGDRRVLALGRRAGRGDAPARLRPRRARGAQPARLPARAAGGHARAAERAHDRARALPRRDRRLAAVRALALRRARPRRLGRSRCRRASASASASRPTRSGPTTGSSCTCPTSTPTRPRRCPRPPSCVLLEPEEVEQAVVAELGGSALFGARFRENAARALLIPRAYPGRRTPLWQQRLKAQNLLEVARRYADFPIVLETYRECLRDVLDVPGPEAAAARRCTRARSRSSRSRRATASPFASSLLFDYVATYMYEGDTPNAERRAAALSLDRDLLRELLGQEELRELIDPGALERVEDDLQRRSEMTRATGRDGLHDVLRRVGDLDRGGGRRARVRGDRRRRPARRAASANGARSALRVGGEERYVAADEAGLYRDALGAAPPGRAAGGVPRGRARRAARARRPLRAHARAVHDRGAARALRRRRERGPARARARRATLVRGELRPGRQRARLVRRGGAAPPAPRLAGGAAQGDRAGRPARAWRPSCPPGRASTATRGAGAGIDRLREVLVPLQGLALPVEIWERDVLPRRTGAYSQTWLDASARAASSCGSAPGALGRSGRVALYFREDAPRSGRRRARAARAARAPPSARARAAARAPRARARASSPTCSPSSTRPPRRCARRCGTSCGRARSPTTPGRRCARRA